METTQEQVVVRQTWHRGGLEVQYRLCVQPYNYYVMTGPHAGPYASRAGAQAVADQLNARLRSAEQ